MSKHPSDNSWKALCADITSFLEEEPLKDGAKWISKMMRHDKLALRLAAVRIIEVRAGACKYCSPRHPSRPTSYEYIPLIFSTT